MKPIFVHARAPQSPARVTDAPLTRCELNAIVERNEREAVAARVRGDESNAELHDEVAGMASHRLRQHAAARIANADWVRPILDAVPGERSALD